MKREDRHVMADPSYPDKLKAQAERIMKLVVEKGQPGKPVTHECSFCADSGWVQTEDPKVVSKCERCKPPPKPQTPEIERFS